MSVLTNYQPNAIFSSSQFSATAPILSPGEIWSHSQLCQHHHESGVDLLQQRLFSQTAVRWHEHQLWCKYLHVVALPQWV